MRAYRNHWANDVFCTPWRHDDPSGRDLGDASPEVLDDASTAAGVDDGKGR
jgi:hypothetical protein